MRVATHVLHACILLHFVVLCGLYVQAKDGHTWKELKIKRVFTLHPHMAPSYANALLTHNMDVDRYTLTTPRYRTKLSANHTVMVLSLAPYNLPLIIRADSNIQ